MTAEEHLWVSVDEFVAEPVRWFLDVIEGHVIVITRDGAPFAALRPAPTEPATRSPHTRADNDDEETPHDPQH
ncbi:hypothetical protein [Curtobacterium sp. PhB136]|uniref:hypothetical protein n=1 Tax=Curtobacterium sp. PhB136 TaxID=2485181 RepID=UPI00104B8A44|nr:hypothetical protein [Curtobacterium sp. PhB136]